MPLPKDSHGFRINPPKSRHHIARGTIIRIVTVHDRKTPNCDAYIGKYAKARTMLMRYPWLSHGYSGRVDLCTKSGRVIKDEAVAGGIRLDDFSLEVISIPKPSGEEIDA